MELSFSEMFLVVIIAFLVLGPEELVKRSRQIGRWVGKLRGEARNFGIMAQESLLQKAEMEELKKKFKDTQSLLEKDQVSGINTIEKSIESNLLKLSRGPSESDDSGNLK